MVGLYLATFALSLLFSFIFTREVRDYAVSCGWVKPPVNDRHVHQRPLPRLGGVAIYLACLASIAVGVAIAAAFGMSAWFSGAVLLRVLVPGTLIFLVGVYDDVRPVRPYAKFAAQALAGLLLFAAGLRILDIPVLFGSHHFGWAVSLPLTILWVIGITNAFNLIDGLDGLAAGSGLFSTVVVFVVALFSHSALVALLTIALAGAILGFLRFNFNPATIFLGDCGSLFIGFMLSALAIQGAQKAPTVIAVAIPVVSFGLPILETALSVLRRLISGRPVFTADREHIHHKLLERGLSHRQVVIVLYAVSAVFALLSLFLLWPSGSTIGLVLIVLGTGIWFGVQRLGYLEFGELRRVAKRTIEQRSVFVNNLAIRRATEELKLAHDYPQLCRILEAAFSSNDFDGFDLELSAPHYELFKDLFASSPRRNHFIWARPRPSHVADDKSFWNLSLDLVSSSDQYCGSIRLFRAYGERPLLLDINLLTGDFSGILADAIDRVLKPKATLEFMPLSTPAAKPWQLTPAEQMNRA